MQIGIRSAASAARRPRATAAASSSPRATCAACRPATWPGGAPLRERLAASREPAALPEPGHRLPGPRLLPGHRHAEPGGLTTNQVLTLLEGLAGLPFVGMDCVEVSPPYDHAELTSNAGARWSGPICGQGRAARERARRLAARHWIKAGGVEQSPGRTASRRSPWHVLHRSVVAEEPQFRSARHAFGRRISTFESLLDRVGDHRIVEMLGEELGRSTGSAIACSTTSGIQGR